MHRLMMALVMTLGFDVSGNDCALICCEVRARVNLIVLIPLINFDLPPSTRTRE